MNKFTVKVVTDDLVNKYLYYKNLPINRKYSSNKNIIEKIDHYLWWFQKQKNRKSFLIYKNNVPIFISTCDHTKLNNKKTIYSGLLSCTPETNLFDLLKGIKIQNEYLDKQKNHTCFISIDRNNKVLMQHWKYFGYKPLFEKNIFYRACKREFKIKQNINIYYKKI